MTEYRITVERMDESGEAPTRITRIDLDSPHQIDVALVEWVRNEVDNTAIVDIRESE